MNVLQSCEAPQNGFSMRPKALKLEVSSGTLSHPSTSATYDQLQPKPIQVAINRSGIV